MDFEDQEEHEKEEIGLPQSYDLSRSKMPNPVGVAGADAPPIPRKPRYRECLKNHAVGIGGHALDGCGEFMAAGAEGTLDALKCAACDCHRNFHRKEMDGGGGSGSGSGGERFNLGIHHQQHYLHGQFSPYCRTPSGYLHVGTHQRPLALPWTSGGGGGGGSQSGEEQEDMSNPNNNNNNNTSNSMRGSKRFRTKFTQEQKEKMLGLAERLGWRIQKQDAPLVQQFCNETGVKRNVLKVWMHNNKHTLAKEEAAKKDEYQTEAVEKLRLGSEAMVVANSTGLAYAILTVVMFLLIFKFDVVEIF